MIKDVKVVDLVAASEVYNKANPDEERVPHDSFGYDWSIKFK